MRYRIKLYPPGGGLPIIPHPTKVDEYKARGWTESLPIKAKTKSKPKTKQEKSL